MITHINIDTTHSLPGLKVTIIKAIRQLTGLGLKDSKDIADQLGEHRLELSPYYYDGVAITTEQARREMEQLFLTLRKSGVQVGSPVFIILDDLRKLGADALLQGEDELANEILQLVLAEKLRRQAY